MAGNPEDHFDLESLEDLKDIMEEDFQMLIDTFIDDSEAKVKDMVGIISSGDPEALRQIAHSIKGSSGNVCAIGLSELARQLEKMGKDENISGANDVYEALKVEFGFVKDVLKNKI